MPYKGYSTINEFLSDANDNYNALQASVEKRYSTNFSYSVAYTWSKSIDVGGDGFFGVEGGVPQKLIAYAVKLVGAGLGLDLYIGATGTAKLRRVVVVGYFKFLNGIHRRVYR